MPAAALAGDILKAPPGDDFRPFFPKFDSDQGIPVGLPPLLTLNCRQYSMGDAFLSWRETYAVGHLGLDLEHKRLVELINEISGVRATASRQLSGLSNAFYFASVEHFRHENSVMRDILDGAYLLADVRPRQFVSEAAINDHCAEHARALIALERMLQTFIAVKDQDGPALASDLRIWFLDHAINHDAHLKKVFQIRAAD